MKREGRQHGMVRSYEIWNSRSTKIVNKTESPATAGIFLKVSSKPTNHSKFTGKCGRPQCLGCHNHPVSKSRDKAKGTNKQRTFVEYKVGASYAGLRADAILCELGTCDDVSEYYDDEEEELEYGQDNVYNQEVEEEEEEEEEEEDDDDDDDDDNDDDDDDGRMSFCEVRFVLDLEDEGWCIVGEM